MNEPRNLKEFLTKPGNFGLLKLAYQLLVLMGARAYDFNFLDLSKLNQSAPDDPDNLYRCIFQTKVRLGNSEAMLYSTDFTIGAAKVDMLSFVAKCDVSIRSPVGLHVFEKWSFQLFPNGLVHGKNLTNTDRTEIHETVLKELSPGLFAFPDCY